MVDSSSSAFTVKGDEFRKEGDQKRKGGFFGKFLSSQGDRDREAMDFYQQAANCYKAANDRESALECLQLCIKCESEPLLKAALLNECAKIIKGVNSDKYLKFIKEAIEYYTLAGRITQAASLCRDAAEKLEEDFNLELALTLYEQASNLYEMDNQASYANQMWTKWADITIVSVQRLDFAKVIKIYEKVAFKQLTQGMVKGMAKDYFFKSSLCFLANEDLIGCKRALENYSLEDPTFENDRKGKFLKMLLQACETLDAEMFARTVQEYQKITPLDKVCTKLLVKAKLRYCPEKETAVDTVTKEINFVDGDDEPSGHQPAGQEQNDDGFDLT